MNKEEILIAIKDIQCRYSLPAIERNFTNKDYACKQYEKLAIHLANQQEKKDREIERLNNIVNELDKIIEQYSKNDYYYKYNGKFLKSEIINDLKIIRGVYKPRKGEVVSLEELESYEPKNSIEEEYYDELWR